MDTGYLRRKTDPADRRFAQLRLTPAARSRLAAWRAGRGELVSGALAQLSAADRATVVRALPALRRLATILSTVDDPEGAEAVRG